MNRHIVEMLKPLADRYPSAFQLARAARDAWTRMDEPAPTPMGFKMAGNAAMEAGSFEPEETRIVGRLLPHVDAMINIGANIGYYSCLALQAGKPVVAFEPMAFNLQRLLRNVSANGWDKRAEVYPLALSDSVGITKIYGDGTGASLVKGWAGTPEAYVSYVPTSTLDLVLGARFEGQRCLILVDIEGAERFMLKGATLLLEQRPKPIWLVEIAISEHQPAGISINPHLVATFTAFWQRGYEAWTADARCRPVEREEIEAIERTGKNTMETHNFLFVEAGQGRALLAKGGQEP